MRFSEPYAPARKGFVVCVFVLLLLSIPLHAAGVMLGDFEGSMDGWTAGSGVTTDFSTQGVTHGAGSLQVTFSSGWRSLMTKSMVSQLSVLQTMTSVSMDVTTRNDGGQIPGWLDFLFIINSGSTGWQQFDLAYPGVPVNPRTDTLTVTIPQSIRDAFQNGTGGYADFILIANSGSGGTAWFDNITATLPGSDNVTIQVNAEAPIRTIPMTMYGANLQAWDGAQAGTNSAYNNLQKATGRKYFRMPGGSWANGHLWSDIKEIHSPYGSATWKVGYSETLNLMSALSRPGETIPPTIQPIVNFPGGWYGYTDANDNYVTILHGHQAAVDAAVAWVQDQTARPVCAEYWEIGNEIGGPWEVGWFEGISGTYYGDKFADFYLAMKAVNPNIKIGAVAEPKHELQPWGWYEGYWTYDTLSASAAKNVIPDFLIIHAYPGTGQPASYNPTLLSSDINDIGNFTANLDSIVANALGQQYVGQVRYAMTEWDAGGHTNYSRVTCYVNALFHAQYILEMARHHWDVSNPWIPEYGSNFRVYPVWYVNPLLVHYFGRDMVQASSSDSPLVRAYAAKDTEGNLTVFIANNSPTSSITADVNISGFTAGSGGQRWLLEPAGSMIAGGVNIQDKDDISINGVVRPDPLTAPSLPSQPFAAGNQFSVTLPASGMLLLKVPAATGDTTPPAPPTGLAATLSVIDTHVDWDDNTESDLAGYNVYRSETSGAGYLKLNGTLLIESEYADNSTADGQTYYYVIKAVDTSWNESGASGELAVTIPRTAIGLILREWWTGISGAAVSQLTSNIHYPNNPSGRQLITSLEGPVNWAENYGTRIRGYLYPPTTGSYTFWIAGDDNSQLWLSTDGSPAHRSLIAQVTGWTDSREWNKFSSQRSSPRILTAGQKYYIEVLHKEHTGGDNIAVAWEGPGIAQEVIPGRYLSPWFIGLYGDFDDSSTVSIDDLAEFAGMWLDEDCARTSRMDLNGDCAVNFYEFSRFAENWLHQ